MYLVGNYKQCAHKLTPEGFKQMNLPLDRIMAGRILMAPIPQMKLIMLKHVVYLLLLTFKE